MRSITSPPVPGPGPGGPGPVLTGGEILIVVVVMTLATVLLLAGLPMFGTLEFLGGAVFVACRTVKGLRDPRPAPCQGI